MPFASLLRFALVDWTIIIETQFSRPGMNVQSISITAWFSGPNEVNGLYTLNIFVWVNMTITVTYHRRNHLLFRRQFDEIQGTAQPWQRRQSDISVILGSIHYVKAAEAARLPSETRRICHLVSLRTSRKHMTSWAINYKLYSTFSTLLLYWI